MFLPARRGDGRGVGDGRAEPPPACCGSSNSASASGARTPYPRGGPRVGAGMKGAARGWWFSRRARRAGPGRRRSSAGSWMRRLSDGGALLVSGDAGVGKTALLDVAALHAEAAGTRVVRAVGAEFEAELSFSGLNHVLHPLLDGLAALPPLHRQALSVALGLDAGAPSDRLVVSNAVLGLLRDAAVDSARCWWSSTTCRGWTERARWCLLRPCVASPVPASASWRRCGPRPRASSIVLDCPATSSSRSTMRQRPPCSSNGSQRWRRACASGWLPKRRATRWRCSSCPSHFEMPAPARRQLADVLPLTARLQDLFESRIRELPATDDRVAVDRRAGWNGRPAGTGGSGPGESGLDDLAAAERARIVEVDESAGATRVPAPADPLCGRCPVDERPAASRSPIARGVRVGSRPSRLASRRGGGWS